MRPLAFFAPLATTLAVATLSVAQTPTAPPLVTVSIGGGLTDKVEELGERDVSQQAERLAEIVTRALEREGALSGARIELVLTDLKPNRPTFQQVADRPGLDGIRSISIGGATIEGEIIAADGTRQPVRYDRYSSTLADVRGFAVWQDAERAYARLATNLVAGRWVTR